MHKRLKQLIKIIKEIFTSEYLDKISRKTKFVQRKSTITANDFLALNIFSSHDMCDKSLSTLCSRLESQFGILVSPQALNDRYNKYSVEFMREIFNDMLAKQNQILQKQKSHLQLAFNRIILNDSTSFVLPKEFREEFKGSGGVASSSAIKIQLQYELLSGTFMCCDIEGGTKSDFKYLNTMSNHINPGDLKLADLGYFKVDYLKEIQNKKAFYISKLKSNTVVYKKNPTPEKNKNGTVKKSTEYIKIDIQELIKPLSEGKTIELKDIYIGSKKELISRLIVTKLLPEDKKKREVKRKRDIQKHRGTKSKRSMFWNEINVYITNVDAEILTAEQVHDVYSLRWQIELMFKIWKSIFNIHKVKKMKIERFKCFLYGRLIALLLASTIVFTAKDIINEEDSKQISEIKAFHKVVEYFPLLRVEFFKGELCIIKLLKRIIATLKKLGIKSKRKGRKTMNEIINFMKITTDELEILAV